MGVLKPNTDKGKDPVLGRSEEESLYHQILQRLTKRTHVIRVKGQRVRASLGSRPEGETIGGNLRKSRREVLMMTEMNSVSQRRPLTSPLTR